MPTGFVDREKGKSVIATQYMSQGSAFYTSYQDNVTATPSATQATALLLLQQQTRITTVAAGAGVRLPPAIAGAAVTVLNDAATNACQVFGSSAAQGGVGGGDTINGVAGATGVALAAQNGAGTGPTIYYCFTTGAWRTK